MAALSIGSRRGTYVVPVPGCCEFAEMRSGPAGSKAKAKKQAGETRSTKGACGTSSNLQTEQVPPGTFKDLSWLFSLLPDVLVFFCENTHTQQNNKENLSLAAATA